MLISSLLWGMYSPLDTGLLATAIKVSKSRHNSTTKSLIQHSPILFQDNIALSLHCTFQSLMFSDGREIANSISRNDTLTRSLTHTHNDYRMPSVGSAQRGITIVPKNTYPVRTEPIYTFQSTAHAAIYCSTVAWVLHCTRLSSLSSPTKAELEIQLHRYIITV